VASERQSHALSSIQAFGNSALDRVVHLRVAFVQNIACHKMLLIVILRWQSLHSPPAWLAPHFTNATKLSLDWLLVCLCYWGYRPPFAGPPLHCLVGCSDLLCERYSKLSCLKGDLDSSQLS
jgi:hypothetical protein